MHEFYDFAVGPQNTSAANGDVTLFMVVAVFRSLPPKPVKALIFLQVQNSWLGFTNTLFLKHSIASPGQSSRTGDATGRCRHLPEVK